MTDVHEEKNHANGRPGRVDDVSHWPKRKQQRGGRVLQTQVHQIPLVPLLRRGTTASSTPTAKTAAAAAATASRRGERFRSNTYCFLSRLNHFRRWRQRRWPFKDDERMPPWRQHCAHASTRGGHGSSIPTPTTPTAAAAAAAAAARRSVVVQLSQGVVRRGQEGVPTSSLPVPRWSAVALVGVGYRLPPAALRVGAAVRPEQVAVVGPAVLPSAEEQVVEQAALGHEEKARVPGGERVAC